MRALVYAKLRAARLPTRLAFLSMGAMRMGWHGSAWGAKSSSGTGATGPGMRALDVLARSWTEGG
jgi:hypothetical protein